MSHQRGLQRKWPGALSRNSEVTGRYFVKTILSLESDTNGCYGIMCFSGLPVTLVCMIFQRYKTSSLHIFSFGQYRDYKLSDIWAGRGGPILLLARSPIFIFVAFFGGIWNIKHSASYPRLLVTWKQMSVKLLKSLRKTLQKVFKNLENRLLFVIR